MNTDLEAIRSASDVQTGAVIAAMIGKINSGQLLGRGGARPSTVAGTSSTVTLPLLSNSGYSDNERGLRDLRTHSSSVLETINSTTGDAFKSYQLICSLKAFFDKSNGHGTQHDSCAVIIQPMASPHWSSLIHQRDLSSDS